MYMWFVVYAMFLDRYSSGEDKNIKQLKYKKEIG